jgi:hypothetical protein
MKKMKYFFGYIVVLGLLQQSCTKSELAKINTQPGIVSTAPPANLFLSATLATQNSFEYFYDLNRFIFPLAQIFTNDLKGVATNVFTEGNSLSYRYNNFLGTTSNTTLPIPLTGAGNFLTDAERQFNLQSDAYKSHRVSWVPIFHILKAYYGFYVSDVFGSIPYTKAFQAKEGNTQPTYDAQPALFDTLDAQLKSAVAALKAAPATDTTLGDYDLYYGSKSDEITKWIKAANSLRLKIAMRLMKRDANKMASIANEVLNDNVGVMASNDDSWLFQPNHQYTGSGGNWDPFSNTTSGKGIKGTIDFMWNNSDPRIGLFYEKNNYSQDNIKVAIAAHKLATGTTEPARRYVGSYASPDAANDPAHARLQGTVFVNGSLTLDTLSHVQSRLISPGSEGGTGGTATFILISYADVCFMRAELAARGVTADNAQTWYNNGIEASINMYNDIAAKAQILNYVSVDPTTIPTYENAPDVKYDPTKAIEQITTQEYLNYFLQPNEAWALIKRTGYPNASTALVYETFMINGAPAPYPRRATINYPSESDDNYANKKAAIDAMAADPDFGVPADNTGRVWWDKK